VTDKQTDRQTDIDIT